MAEARAQVAQFRATTVRTLKPGEPMPEGFDTGFEKMPVMNDFVWIAERDGKVIGILMAAPCHGILFIMRLRVLPKSPATTISTMFRHCVKEWQARGFRGYFTFVDPNRDTERRFIPICEKLGGFQLASFQVGLVGDFRQLVRN